MKLTVFFTFSIFCFLDGSASRAEEAVDGMLRLPADLTQYLVQDGKRFVAVPLSLTATGGTQTTEIKIVTAPAQERFIKNYVKVRERYAGRYPYLVVKSYRPYIIVNQDDDILVVGLTDPQRAVVSEQIGFRIENLPGGNFVVSPQHQAPVNVVYLKNRLDVAITLPPGLPPDLLKREDMTGPESAREATYEVNRKKAFSLNANPRYRAFRNGEGKKFDLFRVVLD